MNATLKLILLDTIKFAGYGTAIVSALTPFVPAYTGIASAVFVLAGCRAVNRHVYCGVAGDGIIK